VEVRPGPNARHLLGNGRLISRWPIRSGVVVDGQIGYCAAGMFPESEGVYLCAFELATGREMWQEKIGQSAQGYLLASSGCTCPPDGRVPTSTTEPPDGSWAVLPTAVSIRAEPTP